MATVQKQSSPSGLGWVIGLIVAVTAWRLLIADLLPLTRDEAYYYDWASRLAWGYFDHPPGVALLGLGAQFDPGSVFSARIGALLLGAASLIAVWRLYLAAGLRAGQGLVLALLLAATVFPSLVAGVITTPDTVLALCWPLALHEALRALKGQRRRWLSAGLVTGLGLLGKYTMVVIGPVFLWALLRTDPKALRTRWPYLGGLLALLVLAPHLLWNAHNDWLTLRFQFGHGFSTDTGPLALAATELPAASGPQAYRAEPPAAMDLGERLGSLAGFLGEQLAFWGLVLVPLGIALWRMAWRANRPGARTDPPTSTDHRGESRRSGQPITLPQPGLAPLDPTAVPLLSAAALFPLALFGTIALGSEVEANWAAMYVVGAVPFVALLLRPSARWVWSAAGLNLALVSLYALHAATAFPPLPDVAQRMVRESRGYASLADYAADLSAPVIADRYQFAAMLNFHQPQLHVTQWPNIRRPSEYSRGRIQPLPDLETLQRNGFWLIARKFSPPMIPGFEPQETRTAYGCKDGQFSMLEGATGWWASDCDDPANVWRLYYYAPRAKSSATASIHDTHQVAAPGQ
ncbi:ArnT family glycosyltransferase [Halochromatium glycolicum]|uniref:Glycosyltransferase RgtA/B/C/D-like domain-containing protein n=1 Tax=Halochromatium glycolicum TaxID=85075 RepID=A0AAJ0X8R6_9GAMM|nr:glycosyltransferase family 39 protein [Halochromatium glycolicum]MBK1703250.1 hypothetical protein [Halochromatium glycolicum]